MIISAHAASQVGTRREHNQDRFVVDQELQLFLVCNGMGGHRAGDIAATLAADSAQKHISRSFSELSTKREKELESAIRHLIQEAIEGACRDVFRHGQTVAECRGMGTALSLLLIYDKRAYLGHVGDSRLLLVRGGKLEQLSRNHTLVQELIDQGSLAPEAGRTSPFAHVLSRALGLQESVQVDVRHLDLLPGDRLLLCSSPVREAFEEDAVFSAFIAGECAEIPQKLVEEARKRGCHDDATVVVVDWEGAEESPEEAERIEQVTLTMEVLRKIYLLQELALDELVKVVEYCGVTSCKPGQLLMRQGEAGDSLYIILKGSFEVSRNGESLSGLEEGNHVGEMALLSGAPRAADVRALSAGKLLELKRTDFQALLAQNPQMGVKLLTALARELSARLQRTNELIH